MRPIRLSAIAAHRIATDLDPRYSISRLRNVNCKIALVGELLAAALLVAQPSAPPFQSVDGLVSPRMLALREA
jgi:hypothetical protein